MRLEDVYERQEEQRELARILMPRYVRQLEAVHQMVASVFTEVGDFRLDDPATRKQLALAAERVVLIDKSTREALRDVLRVGQERGYSDYEVAHGVPADDYHGVDGLYLNTWRNRSETIARTEIATAQNAATLDRYAATGLVSSVEIVESEDTDAPCAARNGQVVPIASKPGLLHPNCRVALVPVVEEPAFEAPPEPAQEWGRFTTLEAAEQGAKARFPTVDFDFQGMHVDTVNPTLRQFAKLADEYPKVVERLEYIGGYKRATAPFAGQGFTGSGANAWAHASTDGKRIGLNPKWYGDPTRFAESLDHSVLTGFHPKGGDTFESVMTHEFGHQVQHWLETVPSQRAAFPIVTADDVGLVGGTARDWARTHKATKALSGYATTTKAEGWAEAFAAQYHGSAATKRLAYVRKQAALLKALHPDNWLGLGQWRWLFDVPAEERSAAFERNRRWREQFE